MSVKNKKDKNRMEHLYIAFHSSHSFILHRHRTSSDFLFFFGHFSYSSIYFHSLTLTAILTNMSVSTTSSARYAETFNDLTIGDTKAGFCVWIHPNALTLAIEKLNGNSLSVSTVANFLRERCCTNENSKRKDYEKIYLSCVHGTRNEKYYRMLSSHEAEKSVSELRENPFCGNIQIFVNKRQINEYFEQHAVSGLVAWISGNMEYFKTTDMMINTTRFSSPEKSKTPSRIDELKRIQGTREVSFSQIKDERMHEEHEEDDGYLEHVEDKREDIRFAIRDFGVMLTDTIQKAVSEWTDKI